MSPSSNRLSPTGNRHHGVSLARSVAYRILRRVESAGALAVDLLQGGEVAALRDVDRALVTELVMGVLRWQGDLDFEIERLSGKALRTLDPEVVVILRLGLYQICFLEKIPVSAAVNESVELVKQARKRSAAGFVNAVLRKAEPVVPRPAPRPGPDPESRTRASSPAASASLLDRACRAMPAWLLERWSIHFGPEAARALALASVSVPPTVLRVTGGLASLDGIERELAAEGIAVRRARYAPHALLVESGRVQASRAWQQGRVVIQDEASQLVAILLRVEPGQRVLDLAAAPGIKSAQLAAALGRGEGGVPGSRVGGSALVACDVSARRLADLNCLLPRQVPPDVRCSVVRLDATQSLPFRRCFDRVLLDAPCSGTGTLARNPEIKWRLRPDDIARLAENQAQMLRQALEVLKPHGRLVYATCSLEGEENERVVECVLKEVQGVRALGREPLRREAPEIADLIDADGYFRTRPDLHRTDGFFAAVLETSDE